MSMPTPVVDRLKNKIGLMPVQRSQSQRGVVLIIALVLLVIISLLAVTSIRNAGSSENVSSNVRTTELATQAADIALRYCESRVLAIRSTNPPTSTPTSDGFDIFPSSTTPKWQNMAPATGWDSSSSTSLPYALSLTLVNQLSASVVKYQRPPECIVEQLSTDDPNVPLNQAMHFVITVRGFGPEVPPLADPNQRVRPVGSEVWLQSTIELQ